MTKKERVVVLVDALWLAKEISTTYVNKSLSALSKATGLSVSDLNRILRYYQHS
jgi:hypothetical protein